MRQKIERSCEIIEQALKKYKRPCTFWSSGKDSMALLYLIKFYLQLEFPVVCWKEPWMPQKLEFTNRVIREWNLEIWDWAPSAVKLCQGNGRIDVLNYYQVNPILLDPEYMIIARGIEPPEEGKPFLCGLETFLGRPTGSFNFPWDVGFIGHKTCDEDPCSGKIPLEVDVVHSATSVSAAYPLRDWTDEDVYQFHIDNSIPFDETRYDIKAKKVLPDKHKNPDYYHTCLKCCDPTSSAFVQCPKYGLQINNISHKVPWDAPKMEYCNLRTSK